MNIVYTLLSNVIIFLVRKKLGLRLYECFKFTNQKSDAVYYFVKDGLVKASMSIHGTPQHSGRYPWGSRPIESPLMLEPSGVSLNWLLNPDCKIQTCGFNLRIYQGVRSIHQISQ